MKTDWNEVLQLLLNATGETLYMVLLAGLFTLLIGLPLGVLLFISRAGGQAGVAAKVPVARQPFQRNAG